MTILSDILKQENVTGIIPCKKQRSGLRSKSKKKNGKVTVKGYTYANPLFILVILGGIINFVIEKAFLALGLFLPMALILLAVQLKDEDNAITDIENRITK